MPDVLALGAVGSVPVEASATQTVSRFARGALVIAPSRATGRDGEEQGSTLLLTIFYCFLGLSIVLVVVVGDTLYLERKRLFTVADGAALAAAESWSLDSVRVDGDELAFELDYADVQQSRPSISRVAAHELDEVELVRASSVDGRTRDGHPAIRVARADPHRALPVAVPIEVTVTARSVFH